MRFKAREKCTDASTCQRKHCNHGMSIREAVAAKAADPNSLISRMERHGEFIQERQIAREDKRDATKGAKRNRKAERKAARRGVVQ